MRILNLIGLVLTVVGSAPLAAQGPLPPKADVADVPTVAAPSEATSSRSKPLNAEDAEAWLDGFIPYALERGQIPGAVVVVVKDGSRSCSTFESVETGIPAASLICFRVHAR